MLLFVLIFSVVMPYSTSYAAVSSTNFLMDTSKTYTYVAYKKNYKNEKVYRTVSFIGKKDKGDLWNIKSADYSSQLIYLQDTEGLKIGFRGSWFKELGFPLVKENSWDPGDGTKLRILSLNNTVKTQGGTFFNCVEVDSGTGISHFAPNIGLVKFIGQAGDMYELVKIKDSHIGRILIKQKDVKLYNSKGKVHRALKKGEGLKVFKENKDSFDVGGGYYVKKGKDVLFYTGLVYSLDRQIDIYSPQGKVYKKVPIGSTIRIYGFEDGKYLVGGGYYINFDYHIQYDK